MKKNIILSIYIILICFTYNKGYSQTVDDIVARHLLAIGGSQNQAALNSIIMQGIVTVNANNQTQQIPLTVYRVENQGFRMEATFNDKMGYQVMTPTNGWSYFPFQGMPSPVAASAEDVKKSQSDLDITDDFYHYQTKGTSIALLGTEKINNVNCYKLKLIESDGTEKAIDMSIISYLIVQDITKRTIDSKDVITKSVYSSYQLVSGIMFPFVINQSGFGVIHFNTIQVNVPIDPSLFVVNVPNNNQNNQDQGNQNQNSQGDQDSQDNW